MPRQRPHHFLRRYDGAIVKGMVVVLRGGDRGIVTRIRFDYVFDPDTDPRHLIWGVTFKISGRDYPNWGRQHIQPDDTIAANLNRKPGRSRRKTSAGPNENSGPEVQTSVTAPAMVQ